MCAPSSELKVGEILRKLPNGSYIRVFRLQSKEDGALELITDNQWYELKDRPGRVRASCKDEKLFVSYDLIQRPKTKRTSEVREQFEEVIVLKGSGRKKELVRTARRLPTSSPAPNEPSISCVLTKFLKRR